MRLLLPIYLVLLFITPAQADNSQLFGTHAFLTIPNGYAFSDDLLGYVSANKNIIITATRTMTDVIQIQKQFEQNGSAIASDKKDHKIFMKELKVRDVISHSYMLPIGDADDSAIITAVAIREDDSTRKSILQILNTVTWKKISNLNFEKAFYFKFENLYGLSPSAIMSTLIVFTPNGGPIPHSAMSLRVARFPLPYDYHGKEKQIADYLANPNGLPIKILKQDYKNININGLSGMLLTREYIKDEKENKGKLAVLFMSGRVITIEGTSSSRAEDKYLDNFDKILNGFHLTKNN